MMLLHRRPAIQTALQTELKSETAPKVIRPPFRKRDSAEQGRFVVRVCPVARFRGIPPAAAALCSLRGGVRI